MKEKRKKWGVVQKSIIFNTTQQARKAVEKQHYFLVSLKITLF